LIHGFFCESVGYGYQLGSSDLPWVALWLQSQL
jgi:hypothetical protein